MSSEFVQVLGDMMESTLVDLFWILFGGFL